MTGHTNTGGCDRAFEFVLVLSGVNDLSRRVMDGLYEAGCDDATPSLRYGRVYLTFERVAESFSEAVLSAIRDVNKSGIGASVTRVDDCDLVSQSDIARRVIRSRQLVGQWVSGATGPKNFPAPVCDLTDGHPLWMWCEVSFWLWQHGIVGEDVLRQSREAAIINNILDFVHQKQWDPKLAAEVMKLALDSQAANPAPATVE